jgi:hypothetical protein
MIEEWGPQNVFEGQVETTEMGGRRIAGEDTISLSGMGNLGGGSTRTWEIWIQPEIDEP